MRALLTVGHSTRSIEEFLTLIEAHDVTCVADVRRFPGSRRHPHFGREALSETLRAAGVEYVWMPALGGRRSRPKGQPTAPSGWRVAAFAAYADHMNAPDFREAIATLLDAATARPTAVLCAEAFPYRCHRRLIADFAELHGVPVEHILTPARRERHRVTPFARQQGDRILYDVQAPLVATAATP